MTENEKLRALLAEAREVGDALLTEMDAEGISMLDATALRNVHKRIDAALAEPVMPIEKNWYADFDRMRNKAAKYGLALTEAQREIEQLKADRKQGTLNALEEIDEEAAKGFVRGAEAMRAKAQFAVRAIGCGTCGAVLEDTIGSLLLPEDEP